MHELGIAKDLFHIVIEKAREHSLKKVAKIRIVVGRASGIDPEYLRHSLVDHVMPGTIAESAALEFVEEDIALKCRACGAGIKPGADVPVIFACPECGSPRLEPVSGGTAYVESIEGE
jgi:hydrogenase nickel incorporation protein HypA/HybF